MLALVIAAWDIFSARTGTVAVTQRQTSEAFPTTKPDRRHRQTAAAANDINDGLIDDDGKTLWASPTAGEPLDLSYLPPGLQIIVAIRPDTIDAHPEGAKVAASLGPLGKTAENFLNNVLPTAAGVEQCLIGLQATSDGRWQTTLIFRLSGGRSAAEHLAAERPGAVNKTHGTTTYYLSGGWAYWVPDSADSKVVVAAPQELISEIIDLGGAQPPLRRDVERLVEHTDSDRQLTVLLAPNFLFSEGAGMFSGAMAPLREPLFWFLGDELSAAALSLHWDEDFFVELIAAPTLDTRPEAAARILAERVAEIPHRVEDYVVGLDAYPFGRRIVARFPTMVRKLAAYSRAGVEAEHAVLRCYLPAVAGHNLLMGAELTMAEATRKPGAAGPERPSPIATPRATTSVRDKLRQTTSLAFTRDTLEVALQQLSNDLGVEIEILGADLQAEGITKNQSFGINMADRPAQEILVEVLRLANPDKTATGPDDPRQKLVYMIAPPAGGQAERIIVTTRSRAAERGDELPAVFRESPK
ncbi:MAG TPA: hypothetical protein VGK58_09490 [Lacipirellulaceae bacterium]